MDGVMDRGMNRGTYGGKNIGTDRDGWSDG
jgi:hypothetical protein